MVSNSLSNQRRSLSNITNTKDNPPTSSNFHNPISPVIRSLLAAIRVTLAATRTHLEEEVVMAGIQARRILADSRVQREQKGQESGN